jgi:glutamate synthase (NADPH/NADH) small chain
MSTALAADNLSRFPDLHPALDSQSAVAEASRCLYCFDAPCTAACPTHIDVPRFIKKIATGNLRGSALTILDANILGLSCSRVCPVDVLCEGSCVLDRYNYKPIEIGRLQRYAMERGASQLKPASWVKTVENAPRVACIGAGPASLACAAELRRHGFAVVVFERRPLPGGLNTYGVAEYKLRPQVSLQECEMVRSMGVEFRREEVGRTLPLDQLERDFDYIFLGAGLGGMDRLGIPGDTLPGLVDALKFIAAYKTERKAAAGERVAVIGAGNTAIDAAIAARRLGAPEVHIFYRRGKTEMPAFSFEYEHAQTEGVQFHWFAQPVEILESGGRVSGIRLIKTRLSEIKDGRRAAEPIDGSEFDFACDMVIPALGQSRLGNLLAKLGAHPKYYAGGDCVNGGREVVDAVADGKRAALKIVEAARG